MNKIKKKIVTGLVAGLALYSVRVGDGLLKLSERKEFAKYIGEFLDKHEQKYRGANIAFILDYQSMLIEDDSLRASLRTQIWENMDREESASFIRAYEAMMEVSSGLEARIPIETRRVFIGF